MILHQALKDVRLLKWILAIWILLNVALYLTVLVGVGLPAADVGEGRPVYTIFVTLRALMVGGFFAIPVLVVQNDPAVGTTAGWFTRPLSWRGLLAAKLLVAVPLFVLLPVAGDLITLLLAGVPFGAAWSLAWEALAVQAAWLLAVMALAAITATLAQFVVAVLLEGILYTILNASVARFVHDRWLPAFPWWRFVSPETMQAALVGTTIVLGFGLLLFAYRRRSMVQSAVMAGIAPVAIVLVSIFWPWDTALSLGPTIVSPVEMRLEAASLRTGLVGSPPPDCYLSGHLLFSQVPAGQSLQLVGGEAWLQYASERVAVGRLSFANYDGEQPGNPGRAVRQVLGGEVLAKAPQLEPSAAFGVDGDVPNGPCQAFKDRPGTLDATLKVVTVAHRERATSSVAVGATYTLNTGRGQILGVERYARGISVIARETGLDFREDRYTRHDYALQNPRRGEVLREYKRGFTIMPFSGTLIPVPQHLSSIWWELDFAWPDDPSFDADTWLRDARLVVVESERLGVSEKHVQVPGVVLSKLPGSKPDRD